MDGERAIEVYSAAQLKLKRLAELNKEKREVVQEEMDKHKDLVKKYMTDQKVTCMPFYIKDQQNPLFVRLKSTTKYQSVNEDDLKLLVDQVITVDSLKKYHDEVVQENAAKKRRRSAEAYDPPVAAVLLNVVSDAMMSKFSVVSQGVQITKAKERNFKLDAEVTLPPQVLASVSEFHRCDTTLKDLRKKTTARKRKYEETKQKALPVIASYLKPNEKQEVDVRGLDGKIKTYEMTAIASKKNLVKASPDKEDSVSESKNVPASARSSQLKISVRELEGALDATDVFYKVPGWEVRFNEWNGLNNLAQVRKQVLETILSTLHREQEQKKANQDAKKKKKKAQGKKLPDEDPPVIVKMRLKGRSEGSDDDDQVAVDDDEEEAEVSDS